MLENFKYYMPGFTSCNQAIVYVSGFFLNRIKYVKIYKKSTN